MVREGLLVLSDSRISKDDVCALCIDIGKYLRACQNVSARGPLGSAGPPNVNLKILTLKSRLGVVHGHWEWHHWKAWVRFHIRLPY